MKKIDKRLKKQLSRQTTSASSNQEVSQVDLESNFKNIIKAKVEALKDHIDQNINTNETVDPEFILWESISYSSQYKRYTYILTRIIMLIIIGIQSYITIHVNLYKRNEQKLLPRTDCGREVKMEQAYYQVYAGDL